MSALKTYLRTTSFNIFCVVFSTIAGYASIYELFIEVPGHFPRITIEPNSWDILKVQFFLDTPTVANIVVLINVSSG